MPLVNAKCTNCGAMLNVNNEKDAAICEYCGSAFIVERAINNYNTNVNLNINFDNEIPNIFSDFIIHAGVLEKYNGKSPNVIVPEDVHAISSKAFSDSGIKSIIFPENISNESSYFDDWALSGCKFLEKVVLPQNLKRISKGLFAGCTSIKKIDIPDSVVIIEESAFSRCTFLEEVNLPINLTTIKPFTFRDCSNLKAITIPKNVISIEYHAFCNSGLKEIVIPENVTTIQNNAFTDCTELKRVTIKLSPNAYHCFKDMHKCAFLNCNNITSVEIPLEEGFFRKYSYAPYYLFENLPWYSNKKREWDAQKRCLYCGGELKGILSKECKVCGKTIKTFCIKFRR